MEVLSTGAGAGASFGAGATAHTPGSASAASTAAFRCCASSSCRCAPTCSRLKFTSVLSIDVDAGAGWPKGKSATLELAPPELEVGFEVSEVPW